MDESSGGTEEDQIPRATSSGLDLHAGSRSVQPDPDGEVDPSSLKRERKGLGQSGKSDRNRGVPLV